MFKNETTNLVLLMEECAEVIHICSKILRFGVDDVHPTNGIDNRSHLEQELGDVCAIMRILSDNRTVLNSKIFKAAANKRKKLKEHYPKEDI